MRNLLLATGVFLIGFVSAASDDKIVFAY